MPVGVEEEGRPESARRLRPLPVALDAEFEVSLRLHNAFHNPARRIVHLEVPNLYTVHTSIWVILHALGLLGFRSTECCSTACLAKPGYYNAHNDMSSFEEVVGAATHLISVNVTRISNTLWCLLTVTLSIYTISTVRPFPRTRVAGGNWSERPKSANERASA